MDPIQNAEVINKEKKTTPPVQALRILSGIVATIINIAMASIGIGWLVSVVTVLVSGTVAGYTVLFGLSAPIVAILITASLFIAYWPLALIGKAFWSFARGTNRFKKAGIITGAILFALSITALLIISLNLAENISVDYQDGKNRVIIDDGVICVSNSNNCD